MSSRHTSRPSPSKRAKARYFETNYSLLMAIIQAVTGKPLPQVYEDLLFRPLGLRHTWLPGNPPLEPTPVAATLWAGSEPLDRRLVLESLGDLYSTADDTIRFPRTIVRAEGFERSATSRLMQQRWNRFGFPRDKAALRQPGWPIEYDLGMMRFRLPRLSTPLHPLPAVIGHTGSTGSWLFHAPELDRFLSGTVDQATAGAVPYRLIPKLLGVVQSELTRREPVPRISLRRSRSRRNGPSSVPR